MFFVRGWFFPASLRDLRVISLSPPLTRTEEHNFRDSLEFSQRHAIVNPYSILVKYRRLRPRKRDTVG